MILQALVNYYEILTNMEDSVVAKRGFSKAGVSFILDITRDGEPIRITSCKQEVKKKMVPTNMNVPEQVKRSVGINPNFLCDNSSYVFGFDGKGKPERSAQCFEAFRELHNKILGDLDNEKAKALLKFLEIWEVDQAEEHLLFADYLNDILKGANFIFRLDGKMLHEDLELQRAWIDYKNGDTNGNTQQCLVTGKESSIARLHPTIKGIYKGQAMGNSLVSFNAESYESYGKKQGANAPTSEYAAFAYGTALNALLADQKHKIGIGDTTVVFWAESPKQRYVDFMLGMFEGRADVNQTNDEMENDNIATKEIKNVFQKIANGSAIDFSDNLFDKDTKIYILGLSPNAARISIRFFIRDSFGNFSKHLMQHYEDLSILKQFDNQFDMLPIWKIVSETVSTNSKDKKASPLLAGAVFKAIITGQKYPENLYQAILIRIHAEHEVTYEKAATIKACLIRKCKDNQKVREVLTLALNKESNNKAYLLGRLFAVLEKIQTDANPGTKSTIKDKYFTSACTTPGKVYATLLSLSQHHSSKLQNSAYYDISIAEIMSKLEVDDNPFPNNLTLEEQGVYYLGYYHQRKDLYTKKNKEDKKDEQSDK